MAGFRDQVKTGGGGRLNGVDTTFDGYDFMDHGPHEDSTGDYCYFAPRFLVDGADEPVKEWFFIGGNDRYSISKDKQELTMEDGEPVTVSGKVGLGRFITSMLDAADKSKVDIESELPDIASGEALTFEALVGKRFRVKQVEDKERNEKSGLRKYKNKAGKMVETPHTYTAIDAILGASTNGNGSKSVASKKGIKIDLSDEAEAILKELVETGEVSIKNLALFAAKKLMKLKQQDQPKADAIRAKILDSDFRDGLDWLKADKKGVLSVSE